MKQLPKVTQDKKLRSQEWNQAVSLLESLWLLSSRGGLREGKGGLLRTQPTSKEQGQELMASAMFTARFLEPLMGGGGRSPALLYEWRTGQALHTFKPLSSHLNNGE